MSEHANDARRMANAVARASYGRLVAIIAARTGDITAAEDALAEAFAIAISNWPQNGVPDNPEGWLVVTARRLASRAASRASRHQPIEDAMGNLLVYADDVHPQALPDERLKLMLVCAHPAIAETIRTPLMLQTVLGLDADRIGRAFLVPGSTMGQRLVRAKSKIREAGIAFQMPEPAMLRTRLRDVLSAIYVTFNTGWDDLPGTTDGKEDFAEEAIYLAQIVVHLMPDQAEALGLLSLMLHCEARRSARRDSNGTFVPLSDQDPGLWSATMIEQAEHYMHQAATLCDPGRFQTEAAIQSLHASRAFGQQVPGEALCQLYDLLVQQTASIGALVSRAAAYAEENKAFEALAQLDALDVLSVQSFQPYWVARASVLDRLAEHEASREALRVAIGLTTDPAVRQFLCGRLNAGVC